MPEAAKTDCRVIDPGNEVSGADQFQKTPSTNEPVKIRRIGNWKAEEWIAYLSRHPDATLPAYVGSLIVAHYEARIHDMQLSVDVT